jgi:hypothetical protein
MLVEAPHGISAPLVRSQDLGYELTFGKVSIILFYVITGDVHPEFESLVHSEFHR